MFLIYLLKFNVVTWTTTAGNNDEIRRSVVTWTIEGDILHGPCRACRSQVGIIKGIYTKKMVFQNEHFIRSFTLIIDIILPKCTLDFFLFPNKFFFQTF